MKYLTVFVALGILIASAVCAANNPSVAVVAGAAGAVLAVIVWRAFARKAREGETVLPVSPEMSTLTFPPVQRIKQ